MTLHRILGAVQVFKIHCHMGSRYCFLILTDEETEAQINLELAQSLKAGKQLGYKFRAVLLPSLVFAPFHSVLTSKPSGNKIIHPGPWSGGVCMALPVSEDVSLGRMSADPGSVPS